MADNHATTTEMPPSDKATMARLTAQLKKLTEANGKYKTLLKLAKERIQQQEDELVGLRQDKVDLEGRLQTEEKESANNIALDDSNSDRGGGTADGGGGEGVVGASAAAVDLQTVRVCQRIRLPVAAGIDEIWALMEQEVIPSSNDMMTTDNSNKRFKEWKRFDTESQLQDFIRRDTGEPLQLPPFSLSPEQSAHMLKETAQQVAAVTEDFRRFRVRSELARKQADAQIRGLQSTHVQSAARQIEGHDYALQQQQQQIEQSRSTAGGVAGGQQQQLLVEQMRTELAAQEAHWKEAYETLLAENNALKSSGSEALLASQWRQRYEHCMQEKEALKSRLQSESSLNGNGDDQGKYEAKYRDLKESFRLYRKKAKEMFEAQQSGELQSLGHMGGAGGAMFQHHHHLSGANGSMHDDDPKISYLRNLMVNYFTSDQAVRDHMEGAIGTVLQFTPEEISRIEKKRQENEAWF